MDLLSIQNQNLNKIIEKNEEQKQNKFYREKIKERKKFDFVNQELAEVRNLLSIIKQKEENCPCRHTPPPPPPNWFYNYGMQNFSNPYYLD